MRRIVLFRFHAHPEICASRIRFLRELNPDVPIYGLYGGPDEGFPAIEAALSGYLDGIAPIVGKTPQWKWKHSDLAVLQWFRDMGRLIDFEVLHLVEWDLLLGSPIEQLYGHIPAQGVGLTALCPVRCMQDRWMWVAAEPYRGEWNGLLRWAQRKYRYNQEPYCCLGPGCALSKAFLERYAAEKLLEFCHDELRLPLFAQILGFPMYDTGLCQRSAEHEDRCFHCEGTEIERSIVARELDDSGGRRAFHPFRQSFP